MTKHDAKPKRAAISSPARPDPALRPAPPPATLEETLARIARRTFSKQLLAESPHETASHGIVALDAERFPSPVLVSATATSCDTLRVAAQLGMHTLPGADLVNRCVNEVAAQGATPLFFTLQLITGEADQAVAVSVATGAATACRTAACTLLSANVTASPALLHGKAYSLSGFLLAACSAPKLLSLAEAADGDMLLGLPAHGLHSSGIDTAHHLLLDTAHYPLDHYVNELHEKVSAALLQPHRSYLAPIRKLTQAGLVRGFIPIADKGLNPCLHSALPRGLRAHIEATAWEPQPLFAHLRVLGSYTEANMLDLFNMGIGMVAVVPAPMLRQAQTVLNRMNERSAVIGRLHTERRR